MVKLFVAAATGELVRQQLSVFWMHKFDVLVKRLSIFETFVAMFTLKNSRKRFPRKETEREHMFNFGRPQTNLWKKKYGISIYG